MLAFVHINKTAGRTVRYIMRSSFGLRHCEVDAPWAEGPFSQQDLQHLRRIYPNVESIGGHRLCAYVNLEDSDNKFRYFTFMRDPLKRSASQFQYNVQYRGKKGLVFEQWIQQEWTRNRQTKMIAGVADAAEAIRIIQAKQLFVGLTERFDESLVMLKSLIANNLNISYKRINVARENTLAQSLLSTESSRQMLIEANRADLELYNFATEQLYPGYQREHGPSLEADVARYREARTDFNFWNLTLSRLKQHLVYKPLLYLKVRNGSDIRHQTIR